MKLSKNQLIRIIREEKRRMRECGDDMHLSDLASPVAVEPVSVVDSGPAPVVESGAPEQDMIVEMEVAQRGLEQVLESVQAAASLCPTCGDAVAAQAPLMEAMVAQAMALQETLDAQIEIVAEHAAPETEDIAIADVVAEIV